MLENSVYSVISPEGCASILWKDASRSEEAANALKLTSRDLLGLGIIDGIVPEPLGGAHREPEMVYEGVRQAIRKNMAELYSLSPSERVERRLDKYSRMGVYSESE
jgi:acetyl-CoA carboxylase carboxyl transferase subunit alpha